MSYKPNNCFNKNNYLIMAEEICWSARKRLGLRFGGGEARLWIELERLLKTLLSKKTQPTDPKPNNKTKSPPPHPNPNPNLATTKNRPDSRSVVEHFQRYSAELLICKQKNQHEIWVALN